MNDFTFDKYKDAQTSPTMYGDKGATWDINPQYDPTHPLFKDFPWVVIDDLNVRIPRLAEATGRGQRGHLSHSTWAVLSHIPAQKFPRVSR